MLQWGVYFNHGDVHSALAHLQKKVKASKKAEDVTYLAALCVSIGEVYLSDSDFQAAHLVCNTRNPYTNISGTAANLDPHNLDFKLRRIRALIGLEELLPALTMLNDGLISFPDYADIYVLRAKVYLLQQNWKAACNDAQTALQKSAGNNTEAVSILNRVFLTVEGMANRATQLITEGDARERPRILRYLLDVAELAPSPISLMLALRKAWYLRTEGKYGWAIDELRSCLIKCESIISTNCPKEVKTYLLNIIARGRWQLSLCFNETGILHFQGGDYEKAIDSFNKAIRADKHTPIFFSNRADCYWQLGKTQLALANYHQALTIDPTLERVNQQIAYVHNIQGCKLSTQGKYAEALYEFTEALQTIPKGAKSQTIATMHNRTKTLLQLQQWGVACTQAAAVLKLDPSDSGAAYITRMLQTANALV